MKTLLRSLLVIFFVVGLVRFASAGEIEGAVSEVQGLKVKIKLTSAGEPTVGDVVRLSFDLPGGESVPIGTWEVTGIQERTVTAEVVQNTGTPNVGYEAKIFSFDLGPGETPSLVARNDAAERKTTAPGASALSVPAPKLEPSKTSGSVKKASAEKPTKPKIVSLPSNLQIYANKLRSRYPEIREEGAKEVYRSPYSRDRRLTEIIRKELMANYRRNLNDRDHIKAMAWFCKVLGRSGNPRYLKTLRVVEANSSVRKIRRAAAKGAKRIRKDNER